MASAVLEVLEAADMDVFIGDGDGVVVVEREVSFEEVDERLFELPFV